MLWIPLGTPSLKNTLLLASHTLPTNSRTNIITSDTKRDTFSLLLFYTCYYNKPLIVVFFKRSFVIHLCCQKTYSVIETNHFQNTKIGELDLLNTETNKKKQHETRPPFSVSRTSKKKKKSREEASWLKEPKEYNHPWIFLLCDTHVHSRDIRRLRRHWRKFFFQKNIYKEKPFSWRRKTLKYFVYEAINERKTLGQVKQSF